MEEQKMDNRTRQILKRVFVTVEENEKIKANMSEIGLTNFSHYARTILQYGGVKKIDFPAYLKLASEISALNRNLSRIGNNINQIAKNVNIEEKLDVEDFEELKQNFETISKQAVRKIQRQLQALGGYNANY